VNGTGSGTQRGSYQSVHGAALYVYVLVMVIGRVPLGAPLACVRSFAAALQNSECTDFQPLPAMA
jgi:hypothetical protein